MTFVTLQSLIKRKGLGLLLVPLLLIACRRDVVLVTPTAIAITPTPETTGFVTLPTETAVPPTRTPITRPTETACPPTTQTPTPGPGGPLALPTLPPVVEEVRNSAELYRLRAWSDAAAAALVSRMTDYAEGIRMDWELYTYYGDRGRQEIIETGREFILRYPNSPYRTEVEWQMVDASTYQTNRPLDEMLAQLMTADLNAGVATLETLDTYLKTHGLQINLQDCPTCAPFPTSIPNLLGDGRDIPLFLIEGTTSHSEVEGGILLAIWQDVEEGFTVAPILSQWASAIRYSGGISNFEARHITGNAQPELLIETWGHSGNILSSSLHMYQWNGEAFVPLAGTPFHFTGGIFADQWEFMEGDDLSRLQIMHTYEGNTTVYEWTGSAYEAVEVTIERIPPNLTDAYLIAEWVEQAIEQGRYSEVVAYLEEALQETTNGSNILGISERHAMRFVLGMNYVYLEDEERARSVFEALRDEDSPPELTGFSQAAGAFLAQYDGLESAYEGCKAAYDVLSASGAKLTGIAERMPLCAFDKLFVASLSQYDGEDSVSDYVSAAESNYAQQYDLDGDGRLDWLLALSHPTLFPQVVVEVWAVLLTETGTETVKLTTLWPSKGATEEIVAQTHFLPPLDSPLIAVLWSDGFRLLQLIEAEEGREGKLHISNIATDYSLQMVGDNLQLDLFFIGGTSGLYAFDRITYEWDAEMEKFVEVSRHAPNSLGVPFNEALDSAEILLLENGDFAAAIPILTAIANELEPADVPEWQWHLALPKVLYLLGLAYEMQGDETQAVATYWQLWHDYPTSPHALIAAEKLEEK